MVGNHSLEAFARQEGMTDNPRHGTQIGTPDDGYHPDADPDADYWLDEPRADAPPAMGKYPNGFYNPTPVPAGPLYVVIDPDHVEKGYSESPEPKRGVFLTGRDDIGSTKPPSPVSADDDLLREAANAHLQAATSILEDPSRIVAVSSGTLAGSLNIGVTGQEPNQKELYRSPDVTSIGSSETTDPELFEGFWRIRSFATPHTMYSTVSEPRLQLTDLDI